MRRLGAEAETLEDVFGWNLRFGPDVVGEQAFALMGVAGILKPAGRRWRSSLAVASIGPLLFLHTAFRSKSKDAVFFGPDSVRFTDFIRAELPVLRPDATIVDVGAGSGVGGLFAATLAPGRRVVLTDPNPEALRLAAVNATFAGVEVEMLRVEGFAGVADAPDLVLANPPYIAGSAEPLYAGGGGQLGAELSLRWAREAAGRLAPGGTLLLYTGSAIVRGADQLKAALQRISNETNCDLRYRELDPDVFPGLLLKPAYWGVDRVAAVGATLTRRT